MTMQKIIELKKYADLNVVECSKCVSSSNNEKVFQIARPILVFFSRFFMVPKNIRLILSHLIEILDSIVPVPIENAVISDRG